jgi:hypothetical protein
MIQGAVSSRVKRRHAMIHPGNVHRCAVSPNRAATLRPIPGAGESPRCECALCCFLICSSRHMLPRKPERKPNAPMSYIGTVKAIVLAAARSAPSTPS